MKKFLTLIASVSAALSAYAQTPNVYPITCIPVYQNKCGTASANLYNITGVSTTGATTNINNPASGTQSPVCGVTADNYSYYTGTNRTLYVDAGTNFTLKINTQTPTSAYITRNAVWVDWNQDDSFDNRNFWAAPPSPFAEAELVVSGVKAAESYTVAVPSLAKHGWTKMRIRTFGTHQPNTVAGGNPSGSNAIGFGVNPCLSNGSPTGPSGNYLIVSGETEDYDVFINNPCVKIPSLTFYNTNSKGTDVKWTPRGNEQLFEYALDGSRSDPGNGNTTLKRDIKNLHLPDTFMKFLPCNTKFYFHIRGVCDTFTGENQALWFYGPWRLDSFTTDPCCDMPPLSITNIKSNSAVATWQPVLSVQSYEYMIRIDTITPIKGTITNTTQVLLPGLQCSRMYYFFIRSLCSPTPTSDWRLDSFLTQPCLGIDNSQSFPEFNLTAYPNPVKDIVTLSTMHGAKLTDGNIVVTDITGKVIHTAIMKEDKIDIDLRTQPAGIYLVRYSDEQRTKVVKISKQ